MKCQACGIKSEREFCSERCEESGVVGTFVKTKKSKYPYKSNCKICNVEYMKNLWGSKYCSSCKYIPQTLANQSLEKRKNYKRKVTLTERNDTCENCGKEFSYKAYHPRTYCTKECKMSVHAKTASILFKEVRKIQQSESLGQIRW